MSKKFKVGTIITNKYRVQVNDLPIKTNDPDYMWSDDWYKCEVIPSTHKDVVRDFSPGQLVSRKVKLTGSVERAGRVIAANKDLLWIAVPEAGGEYSHIIIDIKEIANNEVLDDY